MKGLTKAILKKLPPLGSQSESADPVCLGQILYSRRRLDLVCR
jgi:hypothetical protein